MPRGSASPHCKILLPLAGNPDLFNGMQKQEHAKNAAHPKNAP
jgi:hypothetical protein